MKMTNNLRVEKATAEDFEKTYPLLLMFNNPKITKTQWQRLFSNYWGFQKEYCGYKLVHGDEIVGFDAYIFSKKLINGRWEDFCNGSSWIVKPGYRVNSIDLLYPQLDLKDHTITSFSSTIGAYKVETRLLGLKVLDRYEVIIPAIPNWSAVVKKKFNILSHRRQPRETLVQYLTDYEKKVFQDHEKFDCEHMIITSDQGYAYLVLKKIHKRHLPFAKLYYASNLDFFLLHLEELRFRIPLVLNTVGIIVDSRYLKDKPVSFKKIKYFYMPMLYKSDHLQPHEVDYLYSEFFLLGA